MERKCYNCMYADTCKANNEMMILTFRNCKTWKPSVKFIERYLNSSDPVAMLDDKKHVLKVFPNKEAACVYTGRDIQSLKRSLGNTESKCGGFYWTKLTEELYRKEKIRIENI